MMDKSDFVGRLTLDAFKHDMIETAVGVGALIFGIAICFALTYKKRWRWLWFEWLTSVDHKKIGVMYIVVSSADAFQGHCRCAHDARATGHCRSGIPSAISLRPTSSRFLQPMGRP